MSPALTSRVLLNRTRGLSDEERDILEQSISETRRFTAGQVVVRRAVETSVSLLLVDGFMTRHVDGEDGHRHLVAVHIPGDFVDLHAYALGYLDHDVGTLTDTTVAVVPHAALDAIFVERPGLAKRLWFATLLDAALHRQWSFRLSHKTAIQRVAHFLCEMHCRLLAAGLSEGTRFVLPMTQSDIGEVCGLTNVHVNRVLRQLREAGLCTARAQQVSIGDLRGLVAVGQFQPDYLYFNDRINAAATGLKESP